MGLVVPVLVGVKVAFLLWHAEPRTALDFPVLVAGFLVRVEVGLLVPYGTAVRVEAMELLPWQAGPMTDFVPAVGVGVDAKASGGVFTAFLWILRRGRFLASSGTFKASATMAKVTMTHVNLRVIRFMFCKIQVTYRVSRTK